jgi:molybdate transport system substrate-binding protein
LGEGAIKIILKILLRPLLVAGLLSSAPQVTAHAADIRFLCAGALESWMMEVIPDFQQRSGHHVNASFQIINAITERIRSGEAADLATVSPPQWESLEKDGKLDPAVRVAVAKVGFGVFVKQGAARPDISSVEALRRALLNARSIAMFPPNPGPTSTYQVQVLEQLGIGTDIKPTINYAGVAKPNQVVSAPLFELVARGEADIGIGMVSEIVQAAGVDLVGPMPVEVQRFTVYRAVLPITAKDPVAAKALIDFLVAPEAVSKLKSKGLEPG